MLVSGLTYVCCPHLSTRGQAGAWPSLAHTPALMLTFYMEQDGSADFELLVVDQDVELAGVHACVSLFHSGDQQVSVVWL